ncbi:hypothetical protein [Methanolobus profundi]|uniref:Uncharacterized protein n=1 Tax=Methanolobus profundi TaxID=487685 RepID=A0A1I4PPM2_9EURY|nr:hypothetical protein [Methanolobus profundi]SFM29440.1 hypothetical protein SAMN04488696_0795 [Methanolobus profundi]
MKRSKIIVLMIALVVSIMLIQPIDADIMLPGTKGIHRYVMINNTDEFPDVVFVGYIRGPVIQCENPYLIDTDECLTQFYKANELTIYAVEREYFDVSGLENIDFEKETDHPGYTFDLNVDWDMVAVTNPLNEETRYYSIAGFNNNSLILYESKRISTYVGDIKRVKTFEEPEITDMILTLNSSLPEQNEGSIVVDTTEDVVIKDAIIENRDTKQNASASDKQSSNERSFSDILIHFFNRLFSSA